MLSASSVSFNSSSFAGDVRCVQFRAVSDDIVEEDEAFVFVAVARNVRDTFITDRDSFTLIILDDDGKAIRTVYIIMMALVNK